MLGVAALHTRALLPGPVVRTDGEGKQRLLQRVDSRVARMLCGAYRAAACELAARVHPNEQPQFRAERDRALRESVAWVLERACGGSAMGFASGSFACAILVGMVGSMRRHFLQL